MFAELVHGYRQRLGLTQDELAEKASLSVRNLRNLEAGRTGSPRPATVRLLADVFELTGAERDSFHQAAAGAPVGTPAGPPTRRRAPAQLPPDVAGFTGRQDQLAHLDGLLADDADPPAAVVISAIAGTAGVGKTALALRWAHRVAERFPDGQLYVNLRGYDPDQPMDPADALRNLLSALGVTGRDVPHDLDERVTRFRSEIADKRMLIVLDNAGRAEQVRPLLPGSGSCAVVVTSRDSLAGLVAVDGAHRLDLDLLPPADAFALLRRLIGPRVDAEPEAAATMAEQCARLPLALRIAAELAVSRPATPLAELAAELDNQQRRLDRLDAGGDPHAGVRTVFSWSIQHLPPDAAATFRLLGLHPGPDFDSYAFAALADTSLEDAHRRLDLLTRAHLVQSTSYDRYSMHDLLRAYASHVAGAEETSGHRWTTLERLFDYYLAAAAAAVDSLYPAHSHHRSQTSPHVISRTIPPLASPDTARAWLETELPCLIAAVAHSARGWPSHTTRLSTVLYRYLYGGYHTEALAVHGHAYRVARQAEDIAAQASALLGLGAAHAQLGDYTQAVDHLQRALALSRRADDPIGESAAHASLGLVEERRGRYQLSAEHMQRSLALNRQTGNRIGQAQALTNLGVIEERLGHYGPAGDCHLQALSLFEQLDDAAGKANTLINIGAVEERLGRHETASDHHQQAIALFRKLGNRHGEARALDSLGSSFIRLGKPAQAIEHLERALTIFIETNDPLGRACALNGLGEATFIDGRTEDALTYHTEALTIATTNDTPDQQARAHIGLSHAHQVLGEAPCALTHHERALTLYAGLGMPIASNVRVPSPPAQPAAERRQAEE